jgi:hypothetical protein
MMLSPFIPLSNSFISTQCFFQTFERGSNLGRGGSAPSLFYSPLQPVYIWFNTYVSGWRGARGEEDTNQMQIKPNLYKRKKA